MEERFLERISPSSAEVLRLCFLRMYLSRTGAGPRLTGPQARLGSAVHQLLAYAAAGGFKGVDSGAGLGQDFSDLWETAITEQQGQMHAAKEDYFGPLREWRTYESLRAQTLRACRDLAADASQSLHVEQQFSARGGTATGTPDRLAVEPDGLVIEDFKTGEILESEVHGERDVLKSSYRRQILFYAALVAESLGSWPVRGRVVGITGETQSVDVQPGEAEAVMNGSLELMKAYNSRLAAATEPEQLASPGPEPCGLCPYQVRCEPFWENAQQDWDMQPSIQGTLERLSRSENGLFALAIAVEKGTLAPNSYVAGQLDPERFPELEGLQPGMNVRITKMKTRGKGLIPGLYTAMQVL